MSNNGNNNLVFEFEEDEDTESFSSLPMIKPSFVPAVGINYRTEVELARDVDKLFDFSKTSMSPVQQLYVMGYAVRGTKLGACKLANVPMAVVNKWMENDDFKEALQNAVEIVRDVLEGELLLRAMNGSDKLLLEAVKALNSEKYNKKQSDINITGTMIHTWADLAKQAAVSSPNKVIEIETIEVEEQED